MQEDKPDIECLVCGRIVDMTLDGRSTCYCCSSLIFLNDKSEPYIVTNNVPFNRDNLLIGIVSIIGMFGSIGFFIIKGLPLFFVGLGLVFAPFLGLFQHALFNKWSYTFQHYMDLHRAFVSRRLKYYDLGSKFLVYSLISIQAIGLLLILIDLIIKMN